MVARRRATTSAPRSGDGVLRAHGARSYKRPPADSRPSLFWNAYVGWSPTAPASRLIIPGVLSLRANRLLGRPSFRKGTVDVIDEKVRRPLPTVTGIAARLAITALKTRNVAIAPLLQRAGLSAHDFDVGQQRISAASQGKFLEYAAEALGDSAFGLHLAKQANPREAGLLFYVTGQADEPLLSSETCPAMSRQPPAT